MLSTWALLMIAVVTEIAWGCSLKALSYYSLDRILKVVERPHETLLGVGLLN